MLNAFGNELRDLSLKLLIAVVTGMLIASLTGCTTQVGTATVEISSPKVVLIIGDGMDDQQISIARNYLAGSNGSLEIDKMQYRGAVRPQSVLEENPAEAVYVTGSAPAATAIATGILSSGQRISTAPKSGRSAITIMELASEAGIATGVVTTASVTDATPAAFMTHTGHRSCQGPGRISRSAERVGRVAYDCSIHSKEQGGIGSIAEQIADGDMDIVLGGGRQYFNQKVEPDSQTSVLDQARANGYTVITEADELQSLPPQGPVLGLFAPGLMPAAMLGNGAALGTVGSEPFTCEKNHEFGQLPRLVEMAESAIRHLEPHGSFILVVENEAIDEHTHARQPCGHIDGVAQVDETVGLVLQYAESHPELLVIVTADHGHGAQIISAGGASGRGRNISPGHVARLVTADGSVMGINYATTGPSAREVHTGVQVPLLASGPGISQWPIVMPQTELFHLMRKHLGLDDPNSVSNRHKAE